MIRASFSRALQAPPVTGPLALVVGLATVALPTIVRAAVSGTVTGCEFTPYLPFVLISAVLLRWWLAGAIALASVAVLGGLFFAPLRFSECFMSSAGVFLASSAVMIGFVVLVRGVVTAAQRYGVEESSDGIVFSLEDEQVWASWYGNSPPVRLGSQTKVSRMMKDFLAQIEVGRRLNGRSK